MGIVFEIFAFIMIWGCMFVSTYLVWINFGALVGVLFFCCGTGLAGFLGMFIVMGIGKLIGIDL